MFTPALDVRSVRSPKTSRPSSPPPRKEANRTPAACPADSRREHPSIQLKPSFLPPWPSTSEFLSLFVFTPKSSRLPCLTSPNPCPSSTLISSRDVHPYLGHYPERSVILSTVECSGVSTTCSISGVHIYCHSLSSFHAYTGIFSFFNRHSLVLTPKFVLISRRCKVLCLQCHFPKLVSSSRLATLFTRPCQLCPAYQNAICEDITAVHHLVLQ